MISTSLALVLAGTAAPFAQVDAPDLTGGVAQIISTGLVGVFLLMLIFEYGITTTKALKRETEARQRAESLSIEITKQLEGERAAHNETRALGFDTLNEVLPTATRLVDVTSRATVALETITRRGAGG